MFKTKQCACGLNFEYIKLIEKVVTNAFCRHKGGAYMILLVHFKLSCSLSELPPSTWKVKSHFAVEQCYLGKLALQCCTSSNGKHGEGRCRMGRTMRTFLMDPVHTESWQSCVMASISTAPFISFTDECIYSVMHKTVNVCYSVTWIL